MLLTLKTRLDCTAERCFDEVQTPRLLMHIAQPLVHFTPITPPELPARWEAREYEVAMHKHRQQRWQQLVRRSFSYA